MTFLDLQNEAKTLVIDTPTAISTLVPRMINRAINKLQRKHNFQIMKALKTATTVESTRQLTTLPTDWKTYRSDPYYTDDFGGIFPMKAVDDEMEALAKYGDNSDYNYGSPRLLYASDTAINVYPFPDGHSTYDDGEYRLSIPYWKFLPELSSDTDTNWFTVNAQEWIVYQAVTDAFYANEDEQRAQLWERRAQREYSDVLLADKYVALGSVNTLVPHLGALPPHTQE